MFIERSLICDYFASSCRFAICELPSLPKLSIVWPAAQSETSYDIPASYLHLHYVDKLSAITPLSTDSIIDDPFTLPISSRTSTLPPRSFLYRAQRPLKCALLLLCELAINYTTSPKTWFWHYSSDKSIKLYFDSYLGGKVAGLLHLYRSSIVIRIQALNKKYGNGFLCHICNKSREYFRKKNETINRAWSTSKHIIFGTSI